MTESNVIGPDDEIERAGREFAAWRLIHPQVQKPMTFEQYVAIKQPKASNAWVYINNRQGRTLISF